MLLNNYKKWKKWIYQAAVHCYSFCRFSCCCIRRCHSRDRENPLILPVNWQYLGVIRYAAETSHGMNGLTLMKRSWTLSLKRQRWYMVQDTNPKQVQFQHLRRSFANLMGTRFAVGTGSGTQALNTCVEALGIGPGDEVITSTAYRSRNNRFDYIKPRPAGNGWPGSWVLSTGCQPGWEKNYWKYQGYYARLIWVVSPAIWITIMAIAKNTISEWSKMLHRLTFLNTGERSWVPLVIWDALVFRLVRPMGRRGRRSCDRKWWGLMDKCLHRS